MNYSSLPKKFKLLNNKGIYDLKYEGCLFTLRYYTGEINCHLHRLNPSLWKGQNDHRSRLHCKYDVKLNLLGGKGGGGGERRQHYTYILHYKFLVTHRNLMKLLVVFYNSRLEPRRFWKTYIDFSNNIFPIDYVL